MASQKSMNIAFIHPDLGIGGAERLVVDAAVGLQKLGHKVTIFTSHCDPNHCFEEARDGTLDVRVRGNTLVPTSIGGRLAILCSILRQAHLILQIALFSSELHTLSPDAFFVDQLSAGIPLLRALYSEPRILFYCHFPDKLLSQEGGVLKLIYRIPFDWLESWSTGCADGIVVNSNFTREVFWESFWRLRDRVPRVVYPCVDTVAQEKLELDAGEGLWKGKKVLLSINRFERKKDVGLAIRAYAQLSEKERAGSRLVLAGGYDPRVKENVQYHKELEQLAESLSLQHATSKSVVGASSIGSEIDVLFLLSIPSSLKNALLSTAALLLYTPSNEHLGIVPLEGMQGGVPVLAAASGGPTETIVDGETGWLRDAGDEGAWADIIRKVLGKNFGEKERKKMAEAGKKRAREWFSRDKMCGRLEYEINAMGRAKTRPPLIGSDMRMAIFILGISLVTGLVVYFAVEPKMEAYRLEAKKMTVEKEEL